MKRISLLSLLTAVAVASLAGAVVWGESTAAANWRAVQIAEKQEGKLNP